jgi:hypothetical protein
MQPGTTYSLRHGRVQQELLESLLSSAHHWVAQRAVMTGSLLWRFMFILHEPQLLRSEMRMVSQLAQIL